MDSATKQLMHENMSNKKTEDFDKTDFNDREDENLDEAAGETVEKKSEVSNAETNEDENESITAWGGSFEKLYSEYMDPSLKQLLEENKSLMEQNLTISAGEPKETIVSKNEDEKFDEAVGGTVEEISDATDAIADEAENESTLERRLLEEASVGSVEDNILDLWNINLDLIEINSPNQDSDKNSESDSWQSGHETLYEADGVIFAEKASDVSQDTEADRSINLDDDAKADENRSEIPQMKLETAQHLEIMNPANGLPLTETDNKNESSSSFGGARPRAPRLQSLHEYSVARSSGQLIEYIGVKQGLNESSDDDDSKYSEAVGGVVEEASISHLISTPKPKGIGEAVLRSSHNRIRYQRLDESDESDEEETQFREVVEGILEDLFTSYQKYLKEKSEAVVLSSDEHIEDQESNESTDDDLKYSEAVGGIVEGFCASYEKYAKDMREAMARSLGEDIDETGVNQGFYESSDDDLKLSEAIHGVVHELITYPQLAAPMNKGIKRPKIRCMKGYSDLSGPIATTSSDSVENESSSSFGGARPRPPRLQSLHEDVEVRSTDDRIDDSGVKDQLVKVPSFAILETSALGPFDADNQIMKIDESPSDEESKFSEAVGGAVDERFTAHQRPAPTKNEQVHVFANVEVRTSNSDCVDDSGINGQFIVMADCLILEPATINPFYDQPQVMKIDESPSVEESKFSEADRGANDEQLTAQKPVPKEKEVRYLELQSSDVPNDDSRGSDPLVEMLKSLNLGPDSTNPFLNQNKILKIGESPADEDTSRQKPAPKEKGYSFTRRLGRSMEGLLFPSSLDIAGSITKKPSVGKKVPKPKKSTTSCLLSCFRKRNVQDPDDEIDPDKMTNQSVPKSAIRGNMEDNIFQKIFRPVAVAQGYKIKIVSNTTTKGHYSYKTNGIFYAFSSSIYLKMEVHLKKKIRLRPAGQFSMFIVNPNKKTINEIEVDYSLIEMPTCSMLISRQTKFDTLVNKKTATLDLRWPPWHSR